MARRGKKYIEIIKKKVTAEHSLADAVKKVKTLSYSKFPGSIDMHVAISLPKDKDAKSIKGAVSLPHTVAKETNIKIAVFTTKENEKAAKDAGADMVGLEDLIKDVQAGKANFDIAIASPDVMAKIAVLGKELGPKGLMPNPKTGTVSDDIAATVSEFKKGKISFSADAQGGIHMKVGNIKQDDAQIIENIGVALKAIEQTVGKTVTSLLKKSYLSPTMGPSVKFKVVAE